MPRLITICVLATLASCQAPLRSAQAGWMYECGKELVWARNSEAAVDDYYHYYPWQIGRKISPRAIRLGRDDVLRYRGQECRRMTPYEMQTYQEQN